MLQHHPFLSATFVFLAACQATSETDGPHPGEQDPPLGTIDPLDAAPTVSATPEEATFLLGTLNDMVAPKEDPPEPLDLSPEGMVERTLGRYFQTDRDNATLTLAETLKAFSLFEDSTQRDGVLNQSEFRATYGSRRTAIPGDELREIQNLMRGRDPWPLLLEALDQDGDAALSTAEINAYFESLGSDQILF